MMKKISKPLPDTNPKDIFVECVNGYIDKGKTEKLLRCKELVSIDSTEYDKHVPSSIHQFSASTLPDDVSTNELSLVYTQKFAAQDSPGRKYYNAIKEQAPRGVCPICGIRMVNTLDHYLPKSKIPTLAVTPNNLIPSCRDCNTDKRSDMSLDPSNTPVHIYCDDIPNEPWLFVKLDDKLEAMYYIACPESWDANLRSRLENHLNCYKLHSLYSSHAAQEIADKIGMWETLVTAGGLEQLYLIIEAECKSIELNDINSWKAALYRGLKSDFEKVKGFLFAKGLGLAP